MTEVRAHPRKVPRGMTIVRKHRRQPIGIEISGRGRHKRLRSNTIAFVYEGEPRTIYLNGLGASGRPLLPKDYVRVLSHETLHSAMSSMNEYEGSRALDGLRSLELGVDPNTRKHVPARRMIAPTGLLYYPRFRRQRERQPSGKRWDE